METGPPLQFRRHHGSPPLREVPRLVWRQLPQLLHTDALLLSVVLLLHLTPFLAFNATRALARVPPRTIAYLAVSFHYFLALPHLLTRDNV